jgi:hypothetical protein
MQLVTLKMSLLICSLLSILFFVPLWYQCIILVHRFCKDCNSVLGHLYFWSYASRAATFCVVEVPYISVLLCYLWILCGWLVNNENFEHNWLQKLRFYHTTGIYMPEHRSHQFNNVQLNCFHKFLYLIFSLTFISVIAHERTKYPVLCKMKMSDWYAVAHVKTKQGVLTVL